MNGVMKGMMTQVSNENEKAGEERVPLGRTSFIPWTFSP